MVSQVYIHGRYFQCKINVSNVTFEDYFRMCPNFTSKINAFQKKKYYGGWLKKTYKFSERRGRERCQLSNGSNCLTAHTHIPKKKKFTESIGCY